MTEKHLLLTIVWNWPAIVGSTRNRDLLGLLHEASEHLGGVGSARDAVVFVYDQSSRAEEC